MGVDNKLCEFLYDQYSLLVSTGMFFELYPEATGDYEKDVEMSKLGKFKIEE